MISRDIKLIVTKYFSLLAVFLLIITNQAESQTQDQKCLICHGKKDFKTEKEDGTTQLLYVDESKIRSSPHLRNSCQDCHSDIVEITALGHKKNVKKVQCVRCHYENNPVGAPQTEKYREFQESVHQQELWKGNQKAPMCQTCHGSHDIRSKHTISQFDFKKTITKVCGSCHLDIYAVYSTSVHGVALFEKNNIDVPGCTDCHGEHTIKKKDDPSSSVYKTRIYNTCGSCHASEQIVEKYGIEAEKFETYEESYHGIAVQFGEKKVANCSSCHGIHDIRPQSDPSSSINENNIVKTCGKCHPDANANYAKGKIHINPRSSEAGSIFFISSIFKWLTIITLTLLAIHVLLDLFRKFKHRKQNV